MPGNFVADLVGATRPDATDTLWARMLPFKDDIGLARMPVITLALILANVVAYVLAGVHAGGLIGGPSVQTVARYGAIPYEFVPLGAALRGRARGFRPGGAL
jgi:hypothetical protein